MKKLFTLFAMLTCMAVTYAQSPLVATLNHNDTISVYYGIDALKSAYSASVIGDVITLSSGGFNACNIYHEITIRGSGMEQDSINKIAPTVLIGDFKVHSSGNVSSDCHLTMEGIWHDGTIYVYSGNSSPFHDLKYAQFIKCRLGTLQTKYESGISSSSSYGCLWESKFVQCRIRRITCNGSATLINCYAGSISYYSTHHYMKFECINSVVGDVGVNLVYSNFSNCVLVGTNPLDASNMAYNCVSAYSGSDTSNGYDLFKNLPYNLSNVAYNDVSRVFDTDTYHSGKYFDTDTYQLLDSIRTKHIGTDGTEIGMYGGALSFNPQNTMPKIKKFSVAPQSDGEGKLKVEIEVSAAGK